MDTSLTGVSPLSSALQKLGVSPDTAPQPVSFKDTVDGMAAETQVPANVLLALDEAGGGQGDAEGAKRNAAALAKALQGGAKIEDAVGSLIGDPARASALMARSYQLADELYPLPAEPAKEPGIGTDLADMGKSVLAGGVRAAGGAAQALGVAADDAFRAATRREVEAQGGDPSAIQGQSLIRTGGRAAAGAARGAADAINDSLSERGKAAKAGFQPGGDLTDPATWTLGPDPSIRGALLNTGEGIGSMLPLLATGNPAVAAGLGAAMAGGEGAESGRAFVEGRRGREDEAGPAAIEALPGYRALVDGGLSPDEAAAELARNAESEAGTRQGIFGAAGGAATNRIMLGAEGALARGGALARAGKKAAAGAIEEGTQEAIEGAASQSGIEATTGADVNLGEDSFANFLMGAASGGVMGAGAGALGPRERAEGRATDSQPPEVIEQQQETGTGEASQAAMGETPPLLPGPASGGTIFGATDIQQDPGSFERDPRNPARPRADQSGAGAQFRPAEPLADAPQPPAFTAQPDTLDLPGDTAIPPEIEGEFSEIAPPRPLALGAMPDQNPGPMGSEAGSVAAPESGASFPPVAGAATPLIPPPRPLGPIEAAAQSITALTPAPAPQLPVRFPDQKPGSAVRFGNAETGEIVDGIFMGETEDGATVRVRGQEIAMTPEQFDGLRDAVPRIEEARKQAEKAAKDAAKAKPAQETPAHVEPVSTAQAGGSAAGQPGLRLDDGQQGSSAAVAPDGPVVAEGRETVQPMAEGGLPADRGQQPAGLDHLGDVAVGDDAGQLPGSLTDPAVDARETPVRDRQAGLSSADAQQAPQEWPWRAKKVNSKNRRAALADYLKPGNIVQGYGGEHQRVVAFDPALNSITIEPVQQQDGEWIAAGPRRTHGTWPSDRELQRGPVHRAPSAIDRAAAEAHPEPTEAQKEAGNYRKGHTRWQGLDLSIETAKGSERRGTGPDGTEWSVTMPAHYGYFRGTEASDGDHVDFYMGDNPDAPNAYVIDQVDAETGAYDEAKVMLGFDSAAAARAAHEAAFSDGKGAARLGGIKKMPVAELKAWLASDATKKPASMRAQRAAASKPAPAPQKRPLIHYVTTRLGGVNPAGKAAEELRHRGVTARTAPGLWRRSGRKELDNIPAAEHPDLEALVGRSDDGIYLNPERIMEAMVEEVAGRAQPLGEQAVLQQQARDEIEADREAATGLKRVAAPAADDAGVTPGPERDIRTPDERTAEITRQVDDFVSAAGISLTEPERQAIISQIDRAGGAVWDAVHDTIVQGEADADRNAAGDGSAESESAGVPFFDDERFGQPGSDAGSQGGPDAAGREPEGAERDEGSAGLSGADSGGVTPATETGAEGKPQTIIPGAERSDSQAQQAEADRARSEMQARQQQSKIRRAGGNDGDAGPLFDSQNDLFETTPAPKADAEPKPEPARPAPGKIEDFGEKIAGARKDVWASYADEMRDAAEVDVSAEPLSKSWPAPDYEKIVAAGVEPWKVSFIRAARDAIPTKPQKPWRLSGWVDAVTAMRGLAQDVMDGKIDQEKLRHTLLTSGSRAPTEILGQMKLYDAVGHGKSLKGMTFGQVSYSMLAGVRYEKPKAFWEVSQKAKATAFSNMPRTIARAETEAEAIEAFRKAYGGLDQQQAKAAKARKWLIYAHDGRKYFSVGTKIGSTYIQLRRVEDVKEARRIIAEEADALQEQLDRLREIPADRKSENAPRVGIDHRKGADVTPQVFGETFGFRGVQFGNWVAGGRRQQDLNDAFDALMDLAGVLDVTPRAISLNGTLGLAFGARGTGGVTPAAAHYEPDQVVINLTKMNGAGSLAHEWFHALDNYFARAATDKKGNYITDRAVGTGARAEGVRPEVMDALIVLRRAIARTGLKERSANIDKTRSKAYWGTGIEMHARAFESYVIAKLQDQSIANDYLANVVEGTVWQMKAEMSGLGDSYPYLKPDEIEIVRPAFDALFEAIQTRETDTGVELYQRDLSDMVATLTNGPEINPVPTSALRDLAASVNAILRQHGLAGKVSPRIVRVLMSTSGVSVQGSYSGGEIKVRAGGRDPIHTARHEIIHALRDSALWGRDYGLFTAQEWRALARAARGNPVLRKAVEKTYGDLTTAGQTEEMVAEMYADWARDRDADPPGPLRAALERIRSFFRAVASALRGEGFADAAAIMQRIADGEIGGRGPDGPNRRNGDGQEKHQREADFIAAPGGGFDFGNITPEIAQRIGRQSGPIRLRRGNEAWGLVHIENRHNAQFQKLGFASAQEFVASVAGSFNAIYPRAGRALDVVLESKGTGQRLVVQLEPHAGGDFYDVKTASPVRQDQFRNAKPLWERAGTSTSSAEADPLHPRGQSDTNNIGDHDGSGNDGAKEQRDLSEIKAQLSRSGARAKGMVGNLHWKKAPGFFSSLLTDAMGRNDRFNILSLVPGRPLFDELARNLPAARAYLRLKDEMDAWRNDWQARAAKVVDRWTAAAIKNPQANDRLMDLMHQATLAGVDPSKEGSWERAADDEARHVLESPRATAARRAWAQDVLAQAAQRRAMWDRLKVQYDALPASFQALFNEVRDEYAAMSDEQDAALMQNIRAASKLALKRADREHAKELARIRDEGLTGAERADAIAKANEKKTAAHARAARGSGPRLQNMRQVFEANRVAGPYFPLARFGNYFVTLRDTDGKVTSFSRFQTEGEQKAWMAKAEADGLGKVEHGVLGESADLKGKVDPRFLADVEELLADSGASHELMDAVWQRWLETLPDQSVRTARIHRKGRLGFNTDAARAFSSAMFHGAHQTARLRYGLDMENELEEAQEQAKAQDDPNRAGFIVREMRQRHAFTMSPTNNPVVSMVSGLAFTWYLAMSPASALVNLSQTTIVGVPIMAARFKAAGVTGVSRELGRALADFGKGKGWVQDSDRLSQDERNAMKQGYERGVIDKTQSHDLAAVAESGIQYNPVREKVMRVMSWGFHHGERLNREVTYLAAYRLARAEGLDHMAAVDEASRQVWRAHFSYQNTDRPRVMQSDMGKILTTFRNFTVNMLYRLFRDAHQAFAGADAETRREARAQLAGITLSMFAHAGIKGVWGYGLLAMLLGAFLPGDDDDLDNWLQDALLVEGDGAGVAAWNLAMSMVLNGAPGTILDVDLTSRIGMPDLWFRGSNKPLEGKDLWTYYMEQFMGPVAGIGANFATGASMLADGEWARGAEKIAPNFASDLIKAARYVGEGVTTYRGDPILERVNPYEALTTALGFTPARVSERYRTNTWLKNQEAAIEGERKGIMRAAVQAIRKGEAIPTTVVDDVATFNARYPFYAITGDSIRKSLQSSVRMSQRQQGGVELNPKLDAYLRAEVAPAAR